MKIEIKKESLKDNLSVIIDTDKNTFKNLSCKHLELSNNQMLTIAKCIAGWKDSLINNRILDGAKYTIRVKSDKGTKTYVFKNKYPPNFADFVTVFGELKDAKQSND